MKTTTYPVHVPAELHPATARLVARFAEALSEKLAAAEKKYGYGDGWADADWMDECRAKLLEHIKKGDPRDVAAYCAFLWHHGESTSGAGDEWAAKVVSSGPLANLPLLEWRSAEVSLNTPIGTKLYTAAGVVIPSEGKQ